MTTKKDGGPLPRGTAATTKTRNHNEAGPLHECTGPQYTLRFEDAAPPPP